MNMATEAPGYLDLLFPRSCAGCGGGVHGEGRYLCWECMAEFIMVRAPYCKLCGDPVEGRVDHEYVCYNCSSTAVYFDCARSAARYERVLRRALQDFKYRGALWLRDDLVSLLEACFHAQYAAADMDVVCYVPIHPLKQRQRGYNQAYSLARGLARRLALPLLTRCLVRVRATPTQTHLTARQRAINVKGAFGVLRGGKVRGLRCLLVDDVMTTGATVNACSQALKEAGASTVNVLTVARG